MQTKKQKYTFIITSVINFKDKPLSYSNFRSIYSPEERAEQTILTIKSIKNKVPEAKIILIESGLSKKIKNELILLVDQYIYIGNSKIVRWAVDSKYKGLGEAVSLICANKLLEEKIDSIYFKISGRYFLNYKFNLEFWNNNFTCKKYNKTISTRLYSFSSRERQKWFLILIKSLPFLLIGNSIEQAMFKFLPKKQTNLECLGVEGFTAPNGEIIKE